MTSVSQGSVEEVGAGLAAQDYLADEGLATSVFLALRLQRPLFLEGDAGVGKTEVAKALASWTGGRFVRLQCYEGIDVAQALYEWDHARQLLHLRAAEAAGRRADDLEDELYDPRFLVRRPLLQAIAHGDGPPPVLLVDEVDRADDEFEAFLLEVLSDFQITIPEIGTVAAEQPPMVVLTSNRTRELHDALKRRCLYHWIDYPDEAREVEIVRLRAPELPQPLVEAVVDVVARLRELDLTKAPGVAETINWARALGVLGVERLDAEAVTPTLGAVLKDRDDLLRVQAGLKLLLDDVGR